MDLIDLSSPEGDGSLPPLPNQQEPKSPGKAFLLSLLLPGAGQIYCGKTKRGIWTMVFSVIPLILLVYLFLNPNLGTIDDNLLGLLLLLFAAFYPFAFLDSFYTAREINRGLDYPGAPSPRVAALLNFVTNGFGYVYVGERKKGILLFFLLGAVSRIADAIPYPVINYSVTMILFGVASLMAWDAHRLAKREIERLADAPANTPTAIDQTEGLSAAIPLGLAGLFVLTFLGLMTIGAFIPDVSTIDRSGVIMQETELGKQFSNPNYGVSLVIPSDWEYDQEEPNYIVQAQILDYGCSVGIIPDTSGAFLSLDNWAEDLKTSILAENPNFEFLEKKEISISGSPALEISFTIDVEGNTVLQDYVLSKRGMTVYAVVVTVAEVFQETCADDIEKIRESVILPE